LTVVLSLCASVVHAQEPLALVKIAPNAAGFPKSLKAKIDAAVISNRSPAQNRMEAKRHGQDAADLVEATLRSEGRYASVIGSDLTDGPVPEAVLTVDPGPSFGFADPKVEWVGPLPQLGAKLAGEASMGLQIGAPGRASEVLDAEGRVIAAVEKRGYADVRALPRQVIVDHADHSLRPTYRIEAGQLVRLDGAKISTSGPTHVDWAASLIPWKPGDVYSPTKLADFEQRLVDTGVFDSITVTLAPISEGQGRRPVLVSLTDRPWRSLEASGSYATSEGLGVEGKVNWFNRTGRGDTRTLKIQGSRLKSGLDFEFSFPHWHRPRQTLKYGAGITQQFTDAYDETSAGVRFDLTRARDRSSYTTVGAALDATRTVGKSAVALTTVSDSVSGATLSLLGAVYLDQSDDLLNPRRGWRLDVRSEPILSVSGGSGQGFLKSQAQGSIYLPLSEQARTVMAGRLHVGSIVGVAVDNVPVARRFYAGGGGSVRGYSYQGVGPRLSDNTPKGGTTVWDGSLEVRQRVKGLWSVVAFADAGSTSDGIAPDFRSVSAGAGLGVRYDLGFGPVRFDLAVPLSSRAGDPAYQIYLSIGQSF
jgi:translocation and assembly module TamA